MVGRPEIFSKKETPPGGFFLYNPNRVLQAAEKTYRQHYSPDKDWIQVAEIRPDRMWIGVILEWLGLDRRLPQGLVARLNYPVKSVTVLRRPENNYLQKEISIPAAAEKTQLLHNGK